MVFNTQGQFEADGFHFTLRYPGVTKDEAQHPGFKSLPETDPIALSDTHNDTSLITIIPKGTRQGLQVKLGTDQWVAAFSDQLPQDAYMIAAGTALRQITTGLKDKNGQPLFLDAAPHRVMTTKHQLRNDRLVSPFFVNPRLDAPFIRLTDSKPIAVTDPRTDVSPHDRLPEGTVRARQYVSNKKLWRDRVPFLAFDQGIRHPFQAIKAIVSTRRLDADVE